jgi:hypothetical protein
MFVILIKSLLKDQTVCTSKKIFIKQACHKQIVTSTITKGHNSFQTSSHDWRQHMFDRRSEPFLGTTYKASLLRENESSDQINGHGLGQHEPSTAQPSTWLRDNYSLSWGIRETNRKSPRFPSHSCISTLLPTTRDFSFCMNFFQPLMHIRPSVLEMV